MHMKMHYAISTQFIQIYQLCIYSQICIHTTCYSTISTNTQISPLELITIPFPMAYTHNYILYNFGNMLPHQVHALTYYFHITQAIHFKQFHAHNTWTFWVQFIQTGTVFTVPKQNSELSVGSPVIKYLFHFLKPISMAISGLIHANT